MEENGISFKQNPAVEEEGNKNEIFISNGLRFIFDNTNPPRLLIKLPQVDSSENPTAHHTSDIVLHFGTDYGFGA
jgi:hypothetical protein